MKELNITDPLILEEQILDTLFNIRRLRKEVAVLRRTKGKEQFFKKKQLEEESKAMIDKIKELESKVNESKNREAEDLQIFA
jgi:hypothetical protein